MKKLKLTALLLSIFLILSGCASTQNQGSTEIQTKVTLKQIQKLSENDKTVLRNNGFSSGIWSEDCKDNKFEKFRYYELNDNYLIDVYLANKIQSKGQIYDVRSISRSLTELKILSTGTTDNLQSITKIRSGFTNNKRLTIDASTLYLEGKLAGNEITTIKEGFYINKNADGIMEKKSAVKTQIKCE